MAAGNLVSAVNLVPYEKRLIDRDSHRMTKVSIYIPSQEVSIHVSDDQSSYGLDDWSPFMLVLLCFTMS